MANLRAAFLGLAATMGVAMPALARGDPALQLIYAQVRAGHLDQARRMINQMLSDHPEDARAHYVAAELASRAGQLVIARSELEQAEQLDPGLPFAAPRAVRALKADLGERREPGEPVHLATLAPNLSGVPGILLAGFGLLVWSIVRRRGNSG